MRIITYTTTWGKVLNGEEYLINEFVAALDNNKNADNIKVNKELHMIEFIDKMQSVCNLSWSQVKFVRQYIEKDRNISYYHYQIILFDGNNKEFTLNCFAGE